MRYVSETTFDNVCTSEFETKDELFDCIKSLCKELPDVRLRPMLELFESDELNALVWNKSLGRLVHFSWDYIWESYQIPEFGECFHYEESDTSQWLGWIPMPKVSI